LAFLDIDAEVGLASGRIVRRELNWLFPFLGFYIKRTTTLWYCMFYELNCGFY
jgi:hypothetical protein